MYGNSLPVESDTLHLSPVPLYFKGGGPVPRVQVMSDARAPQWTSLAPMSRWHCQKGTTCTTLFGAVHVQSQPSKYAYQMVSPDFTAPAGSCQWARLSLILDRGAVFFMSVDNRTGKRLDLVVYPPTSLTVNHTRSTFASM